MLLQFLLESDTPIWQLNTGPYAGAADLHGP